MVATKRVLAALARSDSSSGRFERLFLGLSLTDIAEDCHDILVCFFTSGRRAFQRPAPHLDPDKLAGASRSDIPLDTKFERAHVTRTRRIGKCGQKGRPIGNMYALEKFFACKFGDGNAEQRLGLRRSEND